MKAQDQIRLKNSIPFSADDGQLGQKRIEETNNGNSVNTYTYTTYDSTYYSEEISTPRIICTGSPVTGNTVNIANGSTITP